MLYQNNIAIQTWTDTVIPIPLDPKSPNAQTQSKQLISTQ